MTKRRPSRRAILKGLAGGAAGVFTGGAARPSVAANDQLQIACIGTGNHALFSIGKLAGQAIVAVCDVDDTFAEVLTGHAAARDGADGKPPVVRLPDARRYVDYRELLEAEGARIDAVVVATPDHHHAPATIRALRRRLHVYCEKPLAHTVAEARLIAGEAARQGVATQLGTQIHARDNYRRVVELVQSGAIGAVREVHVWFGKGWAGGPPPAGGQAPPATLHWDLWLGPAAERPYVPEAYHPRQWRRWWDFGNGTLGDMGCHYIDLPFWALGLRHPVSVEAEGPPVERAGCPDGLVVRYEFPARADAPPVTLTWYDGTRTPTALAGLKVPANGVLFVGDDGMLLADYDTHRLLPEAAFAGFQPPRPTIPASIGHHAEWLAACRDGSTPTCNFDYGGALSETVLLGCAAYRAGGRLRWDAASLTAPDCPAAASFVHKSYRPGWEVEP